MATPSPWSLHKQRGNDEYIGYLYHGPAQTFNVVSRISKLGRCLTCVDATAEFADLSIGDPWIRDNKGNWKYESPEGLSSIIVRTPTGAKIVQDAMSAGKLQIQEIPAVEIRIGQHAMMAEKKLRTVVRLKARKFLGMPVPQYTMKLPRVGFEVIKSEVAFWFLRILPMIPIVSRTLMRIGFSKIGIWAIAYRGKIRKKRAAAGKIQIVDLDYSATEEKPDSKAA